MVYFICCIIPILCIFYIYLIREEIKRLNEHPDIEYYCPSCGEGLSKTNSYTDEDINGVSYFKCSNCKHESTWNFDHSIPFMIEDIKKDDNVKTNLE